jgi:hypothetical protein
MANVRRRRISVSRDTGTGKIADLGVFFGVPGPFGFLVD